MIGVGLLQRLADALGDLGVAHRVQPDVGVGGGVAGVGVALVPFLALVPMAALAPVVVVALDLGAVVLQRGVRGGVGEMPSGSAWAMARSTEGWSPFGRCSHQTRLAEIGGRRGLISRSCGSTPGLVREDTWMALPPIRWARNCRG
ncbi:hypothetical protein SANTM175S_07160 [Streptomyces antimycoticus]